MLSPTDVHNSNGRQIASATSTKYMGNIHQVHGQHSHLATNFKNWNSTADNCTHIAHHHICPELQPHNYYNRTALAWALFLVLLSLCHLPLAP
jgi:hypothetical protein